MKANPVINEDTPAVLLDDDGAKESALYADFLAASAASERLSKKIRREESKVDHLGYAPKKIERLKDKFEAARSLKVETLAEINELRIA